MSGYVIPLLKTPQRACLRITAEVRTVGTRFILLKPHSSLHFSHSANRKAFAMALPPTWNTIFQDLCMVHSFTFSKPLFKCPF